MPISCKEGTRASGLRPAIQYGWQRVRTLKEVNCALQLPLATRGAVAFIQEYPPGRLSLLEGMREAIRLPVIVRGWGLRF